MNDNTEISFAIILHAGNAKNACMDAIKKAKEKQFQEAAELMKDAALQIQQAHQVQKDLLVDVANHHDVHVDVLLVHAQDHLSSAMTIQLMAEEIIELYRTR